MEVMAFLSSAFVVVVLVTLDVRYGVVLNSRLLFRLFFDVVVVIAVVENCDTNHNIRQDHHNDDDDDDDNDDDDNDHTRHTREREREREK